jgi:hypothetical protein
MTKDDYVGVILGTFTFFVWVLIGFMHWFGYAVRRSPHAERRSAAFSRRRSFSAGARNYGHFAATGRGV